MRIDYVIVGAGILGLSIARELKANHPLASIVVLEKENQIGLHASGRNSGILHAGIYYKSDSLKAKFCLEGSRAMAAFCDEHQLPIKRIGKMIVSDKASDASTLEMLYQRALHNGAKVSLIQSDELARLEPFTRSAAGLALYSPETAVVDPKAILSKIYSMLVAQGVAFYFNHFCSKIDTKQKKLTVGAHELAYGHLFNTAGLYADQVASACGLLDRYTMIPFKGLYYELAPTSAITINHLVYPVPDLNVPFLGVHFTKSIDGKIYVGPTAIPVLGREHYHGFQGIKIKEALDTFTQLSGHYLSNKQGFRAYAHQEIPRFLKSHFVSSARSLIPTLERHDLIKSKKVGIRAQLFDKYKKELAMDFIVKSTQHETHILNAVSPAFTSAFSFSKFVVNSVLSNHLINA